MTPPLDADARKFVAVTKYRFLIVDAAGALLTRNEHGKAISFAFHQRAAAETAARRAWRPAFVWDRQAPDPA